MASPPLLPPHLEVRRSLIPNAGMGLFARERIVHRQRTDGRLLGRYRGRRFRDRDAALRGVPDAHLPYLMSGFGGEVIDGFRYDNHMRWANHSETPNAWAHLESDGVIFFRTLRTIEPGEEITIDYGYDPTRPDYGIVRRCRKCHSAGVRAALISTSASGEDANKLYCLVCIPTREI